MKSAKILIYIFSSFRFCADTLSYSLSKHQEIIVSGISGNANEYDNIALLLRIDITIIISHNTDFILIMLKKIVQMENVKNILVIAPEHFLERNTLEKSIHNIEYISFEQKFETVIEKLNALSEAKQNILVEGHYDILKNISLREKEILTFIKKGKKTREIAEELFLSTKTVENHRNNILKKTKSKSMMSLISELYKLGLFGLTNSLVFKIQNFQFDSLHNHFSSIFYF
jgi:DNA-binding CsgD family transcriptional regulator